ncbi:MAG: hypothetical protein KGL44_10365 [Sphingomonadales bacterium]|nr:hypothetical protein [Sphingomonadales bacterium]
MTVAPKISAGKRSSQLAVGAWIARLDALARDCADAERTEQPRLLREARDVLRLAPHQVSTPFGLIADPHRFEALIAAQAFESAALALLGGEAGYMISRGGGQTHLASVILPGMTEDVTAEAASAALALLSAQAAALAAITRCGGSPQSHDEERPHLLN